MNTREATSQIRLQQWSEIIQDRINSGMKVDDYCKEHQISKDAYFYWLRKVRTAAIDSTDVQFQEINLPTVAAPVQEQPVYSSPSAPISLEIRGVTINVNESASKKLIRNVLEVLSNA